MSNVRFRNIGAILAFGFIALACSPQTGKKKPLADKPSVAPSFIWPASLAFFGEGYPVAGSPCRRVGESKATIDLLDDSAILVGCRDAKAGMALGGRVVATIDGIVLVSVPIGEPSASAASVTADALVPGTSYHATAEIQCSGYRKHPLGRCPAGVRRNVQGGLTLVDITWPAGDSRTLFFTASGQLLTANTNQADGSAAFQPKAERKGDSIIVSIGPERYEFANVLIAGD